MSEARTGTHRSTTSYGLVPGENLEEMTIGKSMRSSQKIVLTLEALHKTKKNTADLSRFTHFTRCLSAKQFLQQLEAPP